MSRETPEPLVANLLGALMPHLEPILLHIGNGLHEEPNGPENHTGDITRLTEPRLREPRHVGAVDQRDGHADGPDPQHLEDPEAEEGEELVALVVEAVIFAGFQDAEEEEA